MDKKYYTLGFLFSNDSKRVALIKKNRPEWQAGLFNGIGGRIEDSDPTAYDAMMREFLEETGVLIEKWKLFGELNSNEWVVYCFSAFSDDVDKVKTMTDEEICIIELGELNSYYTVDSLDYLIPMALNNNKIYGKIIYGYGQI